MRTKLRQSAPQDESGRRAVRALRGRYEQLRRHDFFLAPGGPEAETALIELDAGARRPAKVAAEPSSPGPLDSRDYQHRTWATRPRPGVDRCSSAWLIRRFIDKSAEFVFATSADRVPKAVPFDMYRGGRFKHEGDRCTFEVLQERFGINDLSVRRIGEIVHDLDLKDDRFQSPHAATIGKLVEGLRASTPDDAQLLVRGMGLFEALYASFHPARNPRRGEPRIC